VTMDRGDHEKNLKKIEVPALKSKVLKGKHNFHAIVLSLKQSQLSREFEMKRTFSSE
jgi:hypothetical protein